jgi:hypothetical protein
LLRPQKLHHQEPLLSLTLTSHNLCAEQPFLKRVTLALLEAIVGLGLLLLIGLFDAAVWSAIIATGTPAP